MIPVDCYELDVLGLELKYLSDLCDVLCAVGDSNSEPSYESVGNSFRVIRDQLDRHVRTLEKIMNDGLQRNSTARDAGHGKTH